MRAASRGPHLEAMPAHPKITKPLRLLDGRAVRPDVCAIATPGEDDLDGIGLFDLLHHFHLRLHVEKLLL